jgi:hypothetical protein
MSKNFLERKFFLNVNVEKVKLGLVRIGEQYLLVVIHNASGLGLKHYIHSKKATFFSFLSENALTYDGQSPL